MSDVQFLLGGTQDSHSDGDLQIILGDTQDFDNNCDLQGLLPNISEGNGTEEVTFPKSNYFDPDFDGLLPNVSQENGTNEVTLFGDRQDSNVDGHLQSLKI